MTFDLYLKLSPKVYHMPFHEPLNVHVPVCVFFPLLETLSSLSQTDVCSNKEVSSKIR